MPKYPLTDKQKDLLRVLVPGLENGEVGTECILMLGNGGISRVSFVGNGAKPFISDIWQGIKRSDFDKFVSIGFFTPMHSTGYTLDEYLITEAVKNDFEVNNWHKNEAVNQYNLLGDFRELILNIAFTLTDVKQSIGAIPSMDDDTKTKLSALFDELQQELEDVPEEYNDDVEAIVGSAKMAIEQLNRDKPNKTMLSVSVKGLKKAAGNIASILPNVVVTVGKIVEAFVPFL